MVAGVFKIDGFASFLLYRIKKLILQLLKLFMSHNLLFFHIIRFLLYLKLLYGLSFPRLIQIADLISFGWKLSVDIKLSELFLGFCFD